MAVAAGYAEQAAGYPGRAGAEGAENLRGRTAGSGAFGVRGGDRCKCVDMDLAERHAAGGHENLADPPVRVGGGGQGGTVAEVVRRDPVRRLGERRAASGDGEHGTGEHRDDEGLSH
jgi:hypothetical protein